MRILIAALLVALAGGVVAVASCSDEPHAVAVTFSEAGGLKPGDNVTVRGLRVGQVARLDIHGEGVLVRLEIEPRHQKHLDDQATFRIDDERLVTGKKMVVVEPGSGAPLKSGAVVAGQALSPGPIARAEAAAKRTVDHAREQTKGLGRVLLNPDQQPPRAVGGTVDLDRPGRFRIRLQEVRVYATTADGSDWDGPGAGEPDLLTQVWVGSRQVLLTEVEEDVTRLRWKDAVSQPFDLGPDVQVRIKVLDVDVGVNDEIGVVELGPTPADSGRVFRLAAGRVAELRLSLEPVKPSARQAAPKKPAVEPQK